MFEYSFSNLSKEVQKRPQTITEIADFISYLISPSCKRLAQNKTADEFVNVLFYVLEKKKKIGRASCRERV